MLLFFWISLLFIIYTYLGYPLIIVLWSKLFPKPVSSSKESCTWRRITLIVVAYNEEDNILRKIENCRKLDYPKELLEICIVSDGSTDKTNEILGKQTDIRTIIDIENHGKPYQINRSVRETTGDIIVFSDARQSFDKAALKMLVRNFSDPAIGAVSGELVFVSSLDHTEQSIGLYWKYEKILRRAESTVDSTLGVTGAIYAILREHFSPIPEDMILDDVEIPLRSFKKGYRVIFEPEAVAYDAAAADARYEFRRKVRTLTGNFQLFARNPWLLNPLANRIFFQAISHKAFRLIVPYALLAVLFSSFSLDELVYRILLYAQLCIYVTGGLTLLVPVMKKNRIINFISVFLMLTAASVLAFIDYLFKRSTVKWRT